MADRSTARHHLDRSTDWAKKHAALLLAGFCLSILASVVAGVLLRGGDDNGDPPSPPEVRELLAQKLFGSDVPTNHDLELYGTQNADLDGTCQGYDGGHSGWHVQAQSVAVEGDTAATIFHSLTTGRVISVGGDYNKIAVYDDKEHRTTLYAHARHVLVSENDLIDKVGTPLGIQGDTGLSPGERPHVHVEVREGEQESLACGATSSINPFEYLYRSATAGDN